MENVQITPYMLNLKVTNRPSRFDMAINFYCCVKRDDKYFLVTYYYNPGWNMYYPFYDDINKSPVIKESKANTYKELLNEANETIDINLDEKINLAKKRFAELIGCKCDIKYSKFKETFELKYSKTANLYTIYKFYNCIITSVENISMILNPSKLKCKLQVLENMSQSDVASNAIYFCKIADNELKENALIL